MKLNRQGTVRLENLHRRIEAWLPPPEQLPPLPKKLLLIRPTVRGDAFTAFAWRWAEDVKTRALAEGWEVEDLGGAHATRARVEEALSRVAVQRPRLVMHYDHGSELTLYGHSPRRGRQSIEDLVPVIDETNIELTAGMFVSAVACYSAAQLGPLAMRSRASGYLGYSDALVTGWWRPTEQYGAAINAPNYALLEGRSPQEAFAAGLRAWERLEAQLFQVARERGANRPDARMAGLWARWNRDALTLLVP